MSKSFKQFQKLRLKSNPGLSKLTDEERSEMSKLEVQALKAFAGSPKQKEYIKKLNVLRVKADMGALGEGFNDESEDVELEETKDTGKLMVSKANKLIARWKKEGKTDAEIKKGLKIHFPSLRTTDIKISESTDLHEDAVDQLEEKLSVKDGMGTWISDFKKSDAPQFDGKSDKERRDMAIAAFMSAKNESVNEGLDMYASASEWVDTYNDLMTSDEKTQEEISDYILARRRQIRRTDTTGGNNDEY